MDSHSGPLDRRTFVTGTGTALGAAALGGVAGASERDDEDESDANRDPDDRPALIAHRGFAGVAPENTVGAVEFAAAGGSAESAARQGADAIEIDVMVTSDGQLVAFHDDRLAGRDGGERGLTDREGIVWETPWAEVREAEVLGSGETVPSLSAVMDAIPAHVRVNVELKNPGSSDLRFAEQLDGDDLDAAVERWQPFVADVLDVVGDYPHDVLCSSFYEGALAATRNVDDSVPVAPLLWDDVETGLALARRYDAEAVHPPYNMVSGTPFYEDQYYVSGPFADVDLVEVAHAEGREVNVYTLATWYQAKELAAAGVDGLIADYPNLLSF
jgi:glycerophosphoryl diester phosphodiesterase